MDQLLLHPLSESAITSNYINKKKFPKVTNVTPQCVYNSI